MTEIDVLKYDLAQERKAFDKLHKQYIQLLHKQSELEKENEQLKKLLECSRQEANDYCEELMGKDEFIRLYKRIGDELKEENKQLKNIIVFAYTLMSRNTISDEDYFEFYELCENIGVSLND